jgi:hypothetical protein
MIEHPYTTFFDQLSPNLSPGEKELRYDHPSGLVWCNQLGMLYPIDEEDWIQIQGRGTIKVNRPGGIITMHVKERVVYQCYHGMVDDNRMVQHKNGNMLDYRESNLIIYPPKSTESRTHNTMMSVIEEATIRYMNDRSLELYKQNLDPDYYWELVQPGEALVKKWRISFERYLALYLPHEQSKGIQY